MASPSSGRFTWHELMTTDPVKAAAFYAGLFGWKVAEMPMGASGTYRVFSNADQRAGGAMAAPPGVPSSWLVYVGADDPDASCAKIKEHGGTILVPPTDVPGMVRFAVATDPQGAAFGVLKGLGPDADAPLPAGPPAIGAFCWDELYTKDQAAAAKFYGAVFGWTGKVAPDDPMKYWHWLNAGQDIGGMMNLPAPGIPPHWLAYVSVSDVDATFRKAKELGAKVAMEPMEMPKVGKFGVLLDPTGAAFALYQSARA